MERCSPNSRAALPLSATRLSRSLAAFALIRRAAVTSPHPLLVTTRNCWEVTPCLSASCLYRLHILLQSSQLFPHVAYARQPPLTGGVPCLIFRPRSASGQMRLCAKLRRHRREVYNAVFRCCGDSQHYAAIGPQFSAIIRR